MGGENMQNQNKFRSDAQKVKQDIQRDLQSANQQGQKDGAFGTSQTDAQKIRQDIQRDLQSGSQNQQNR